jgi:hypothetical protein
MIRNFLIRISDHLQLRHALRRLGTNSTFSTSKVGRILRTYTLLFNETSEIITKLINSLPKPDNPTSRLKMLTLHYLAEQIMVTPFNLIALIRRDPLYAHTNAAALNRTLFESAVNCLYILPDDKSRFGAFCINGVRQELAIQLRMKDWLSHPDAFIARHAKKQYYIKNATTEELLETFKQSLGFGDAKLPVYPNIKNRCSSLGDRWAFEYDARYKGLSAWQHGDFSRVGFSRTMSQILPEEIDRAVFESLGMVAWAFDLTYIFLKDLISHCNDQDSATSLERIYYESFIVVKHHLGESIRHFQGE